MRAERAEPSARSRPLTACTRVTACFGDRVRLDDTRPWWRRMRLWPSR